MTSRSGRHQKDPARDAALTAAFHRMLSRLTPPRRPMDGVPIPHGLQKYPDWPQWPGWLRVQVDVRLLK